MSLNDASNYEELKNVKNHTLFVIESKQKNDSSSLSSNENVIKVINEYNKIDKLNVLSIKDFKSFMISNTNIKFNEKTFYFSDDDIFDFRQNIFSFYTRIDNSDLQNINLQALNSLSSQPFKLKNIQNYSFTKAINIDKKNDIQLKHYEKDNNENTNLFTPEINQTEDL